jgi:hypothetical protein
VFKGDVGVLALVAPGEGNDFFPGAYYLVSRGEFSEVQLTRPDGHDFSIIFVPDPRRINEATHYHHVSLFLLLICPLSLPKCPPSVPSLFAFVHTVVQEVDCEDLWRTKLIWTLRGLVDAYCLIPPGKDLSSIRDPDCVLCAGRSDGLLSLRTLSESGGANIPLKDINVISSFWVQDADPKTRLLLSGSKTPEPYGNLECPFPQPSRYCPNWEVIEEIQSGWKCARVLLAVNGPARAPLPTSEHSTLPSEVEMPEKGNRVNYEPLPTETIPLNAPPLDPKWTCAECKEPHDKQVFVYLNGQQPNPLRCWVCLVDSQRLRKKFPQATPGNFNFAPERISELVQEVGIARQEIALTRRLLSGNFWEFLPESTSSVHPYLEVENLDHLSNVACAIANECNDSSFLAKTYPFFFELLRMRFGWKDFVSRVSRTTPLAGLRLPRVADYAIELLCLCLTQLSREELLKLMIVNDMPVPLVSPFFSPSGQVKGVVSFRQNIGKLRDCCAPLITAMGNAKGLSSFLNSLFECSFETHRNCGYHHRSGADFALFAEMHVSSSEACQRNVDIVDIHGNNTLSRFPEWPNFLRDLVRETDLLFLHLGLTNFDNDGELMNVIDSYVKKRKELRRKPCLLIFFQGDNCDEQRSFLTQRFGDEVATLIIKKQCGMDDQYSLTEYVASVGSSVLKFLSEHFFGETDDHTLADGMRGERGERVEEERGEEERGEEEPGLRSLDEGSFISLALNRLLSAHDHDALSMKASVFPLEYSARKERLYREAIEGRLKGSGQAKEQQEASDALLKHRKDRAKHGSPRDLVVAFRKMVLTQPHKLVLWKRVLAQFLDPIVSGKRNEILDLRTKGLEGHNNAERIEELETTIKNMEIGIDTFMRELFERSQGSYSKSGLAIGSLKDGDKFKDSAECSKALVEFAKYVLSCKQALELINGDSMLFNTSFLDQLSFLFRENKYHVVSIMGAQSSGKSSFLNATFQVRLEVSAGRCTGGVMVSQRQMRLPNGKELATFIFDTEGQFSPERKDTLFDKKVLLVLSLLSLFSLSSLFSLLSSLFSLLSSLFSLLSSLFSWNLFSLLSLFLFLALSLFFFSFSILFLFFLTVNDVSVRHFIGDHPLHEISTDY